MAINIEELKQITLRVLSEIQSCRGNEIELVEDYYWDIPRAARYNPYEEPKQLSLGQLSFDEEEVKRLLRTDDAVAYDLKRIAAIFYALSIDE